MHEFKTDFYGYDMKALVLGYIRPELQYTSRGIIVHRSLSPILTTFHSQKHL
jgi:hypothetical protein